jgi:hypothetical protein
MNRFNLRRLREQQQARRAEAAGARPAAPAPGAAHKRAAPRAVARPTILFLDDEDRILNALAALFRY